MKPNARLWIYYPPAESCVKITLAPGQSLSWRAGGPDEEGWHSEGETYSYDGEIVTVQASTDGQDCDGRISTYREHHCPVGELRAYPNSYAGLPMPEWREGIVSQRDYSAEAMNY